MALFFAYGTELDQVKVLAKTLVNGSQATRPGEGSPPDAAPDIPSYADPSSLLPPHPESATDSAAVMSPAPQLYSYPFQTALAQGYIVDKKLSFRRPDGDSGELITDLETKPGARVWGLLFDLSEDALEAMCREFDAWQSCTRQQVAIDKLLPGWNAEGSALRAIRDNTVEATCLIAGNLTHRANEVDEATTRMLLACYEKYDAPVSAYLDLFPQPVSSVNSLRLGDKDLTEREVVEIYYKAPPRYAVYRNEDRVAVQYADDYALAETQRSAMAALNSTRSQITGLIDGWEKSRYASFATRASRYNARVAAALNQCLEGDGKSASMTLDDIRSDVIDERASWGRFQYLLGALSMAVVFCAVFWLVKTFVYPASHPTHNLWLAARAGAAGAFFSIAMTIRDRKVLTDLHTRDNLADSALRITVGCLGAGVLLCLLQSGLLPAFSMGSTPLTGKSMGWDAIVVMGFIAGFAERLVPNIVDTVGMRAAKSA